MRPWVALLAVIVSACNPASDRGGGRDGGAEKFRPASGMNDIEGRWRVVSLDGRRLPATAEEPFIAISSDAIGGSIGCNRFGGLALFADGRMAVHSWGGTVMSCPGRLDAQEQAISKLFLANPQVLLENNRLEVRSPDHRLELQLRARSSEPKKSPDPMRIPVAGPDSQTLAGTRWIIRDIDGKAASSTPEDRHLRFSQNGWQGLASCATLFGTYAIRGNRLRVDDKITSTEQNCANPHVALDDAFAELMRSDPHYLMRPSGELLIAGGGHVLRGQAER